MKSIKIYLVIVSVLLVLAVGIGVYVWYTLQKLDTQVEGIQLEQQQKKSTAPTDVSSGSVQTVTKPITVQTNTLTETQQKILKGFGYTQSTLTITPAMVTCAEEAVGKARLAEIMDGATPSTFESMKLLPCFKA
jgi:flagellar basal body-associated protein FliL